MVSTRSEYNPLRLTTLPQTLNRLYEASYNWRFLLWSPLVGVLLVLLCFKRSVQVRDRDELMISGTLLVQLLGVFVFSIAAEYRYLLIFFYAPLLLLPMAIAHRTGSRAPLASGAA